MKERPIIALANFHPFITRNILDAGVLDALKAKAEKVVVFVPSEKEEYLQKLYQDGNVEIIGINLDRPVARFSNRFFRRFAELLLDTTTKRNHQKVYRAEGGSALKYYGARCVMLLLGHRPLSSLVRPLFRLLDQVLNNPDPFKEHFTKRHFDIAFTTDAFSEYDIMFVKSAKRARIRIVSMVRSWDNLSNKSILRFMPDVFIVQNRAMQAEAMRYHGIPSSIIRLSGVPQFEYYTRYQPIPREEFAKQMGLDPQKRYVLYSPAGKKFIDTDWQVCEILKRLKAEGKLPSDVQFIVRLHPQNFTDLSKFVSDEDFVIEDPGVGLKTDRLKEVELSRQNVNHLADELFHSSVVINVVSSMVIDAAIFDRPVVTVGFNGWKESVPFLKSVEREHGEEWLTVLFDSGVTPLAKSPDELARLVSIYLAHPEEGREVRKQFVEDHCYKFDGKSPERIASFVLE